jgi:pimeloyl-ACP methyl ester carboxylesterase
MERTTSDTEAPPRDWRAVLLKTVKAIAILAGMLVFIYLVQDRMIFFNVDSPLNRAFFADRPGYEQVAFTASNGATYHGMLYRAPGEVTPLIIYFGGNGEVSYNHLRFRYEADSWDDLAGYSFLFIDYPGYGLNEGRPHYRTMYEQALDVYDYATTLEGIDVNTSVAMGFSIGTGSAVYLAAHRPLSGLILLAPYAEGADFYNNALPIFFGPLRRLVRQRIPSFEYAPHVTCPVLIIASRGDRVIPFSSSKRLSRYFTGQVEFIDLSYGSHNEIMGIDQTRTALPAFLEQVAR